MKKLVILMLGMVMLFIYSCASAPKLQPEILAQLLEKEDFTFMAKRANPTNYDVINIINSMPNSTSTRILDLDYGYGFVLNKEELVVTLPYFGRMFSGTQDQDKQSFRFTSKNFVINKTKSKKGNDVWIIKPNDVSHIRNIYLEIFKGGNAYVSIDANDRQAISYDGYLMKTETKK